MGLALTQKINEPVYIGEKQELCVIITHINRPIVGITVATGTTLVSLLVQVGHGFDIEDDRINASTCITVVSVRKKEVVLRYDVPRHIPIDRESMMLRKLSAKI